VPRSKPPYPAEFRQQIVQLVRAGRTPAELAKEFGCSGQAIRNWVAQDAIDQGKPAPGKEGALTTVEREELVRLRRQLRQVEQECDILVKATAWFAARHDKTSTGSSNS
jgi:transposase